MPAELRTDDVLLGALVLARPQNPIFTGVSQDIHQAVNDLQEEFSDLLGEFYFATETPYPYSKELASSLAHLQRARLVGMQNPDFCHYFLQDAAPGVFDRAAVRRGANRETLNRLTSLSRALWQRIEAVH